MGKFEVANGYDPADVRLPERKTSGSAGYDFYVCKDTLIPPYKYLMSEIAVANGIGKWTEPLTLEEMGKLSSSALAKPTLVPTGVKAKLDYGTYLNLAIRSSCPLKYWLILANSQGVIDEDYYDNPSNNGAIYFQIINLSPLPILLKKGDCIGQGIILDYKKIDNDTVDTVRIGGFGSTNG